MSDLEQSRAALGKLEDAAELVRQAGYLVDAGRGAILSPVYDLLTGMAGHLAADIAEAER